MSNMANSSCAHTPPRPEGEDCLHANIRYFSRTGQLLRCQISRSEPTETSHALWPIDTSLRPLDLAWHSDCPSLHGDGLDAAE